MNGHAQQTYQPIRRPPPPPGDCAEGSNIQALSPEAFGFLQDRGIGRETAERANLFCYRRNANAYLAFGYADPDGGIGSAKVRSLVDKRFFCDGAPRTFWYPFGPPDPTKDLYIVEGEMDALSLAEAGIANVVSVPNGAPDKPVKGDAATKFEYLTNEADLLAAVPRVILATDDDDAGKILRDEIEKRIGRTCWHVHWKSLVTGAKDPNDMLLQHGIRPLRSMLDAPICAGIRTVRTITDEVRKLYSVGRQPGLSTGYATMDRFYTVARGQLCVTTGIPNRGKSSFIDQIMVNICKGDENQRFLICSLENDPVIHSSMLVEKYTGFPFGKGLESRVSEPELRHALEWLDYHFSFLSDDIEPSVTSILDRAREIIRDRRLCGMVIDPFNYLSREGENEYTFINDLLSRLRSFAREEDIHLWIVAHPRILRERRDGAGQYQVPMGYEISGSHAWFSKADIGMTVDVPEDNITQVHIWKCRYPWIGQKGVATLEFNKTNGTYSELDLSEF
jgi:twinkle protein